MNIAITGGYGSGKSSVSRLISGYLGGTLVNTDLVCKVLLEPEEEGYLGLIDEFGSRFIGPDGYVNRSALREATFSDDAVKVRLEAILHPLVRNNIRIQGRDAASRSSFLIAEIPLLYEVGWQEDFAVSVLVRADNDTSVSRTVTRDGITREQALRIMDLQLPMTCKEQLADYIIDNGCSFVSTVQQTAWLATLLKKKVYIK